MLLSYSRKRGITAMLNLKQNLITGVCSTITSTRLDKNKVLISDANGKVTVQQIYNLESSYLSGLDSNLMTKLSNLINLTSTPGSGVSLFYSDKVLSRLLPGNKIPITRLIDTGAPGDDGQLKLDVDPSAYSSGASIDRILFGFYTPSELIVLLNDKPDFITGAASSIASSFLDLNKVLISSASGKVTVSSITSTELSYLSGLTSNLMIKISTLKK